MSKGPFPRSAVLYVKAHMDEWPSVLAYHIGVLFDYPCTKRGVQGLMLRLKKKNK